MDEININVLRELQEYAQLYFESIVELNTVDGKCTLKPGKYSAKDMQDNSHKSVFGHSYPLPEDSIYDEVITIKCGTFECEFPYRRIFTILARWEAMCKAGKLKAVFEIGEYEEKSAKVLINDRTILGSFKTKTMKLQRIAGNWWGLPKEIRKENGVTGYYELNGVMFAPGKTFYGNPRDDANKAFTDKFDDAKMSELLIKFVSDESNKKYDNYEYYIEVINQAGIDTTTEEAKAIAEAAIEERRKRDEEEARELAERKARAEETRRKLLEEEEQIKRKMAESLAKAKENFVNGKMISREEFEDIVESIGYEINIRTLGTLRKRITWIEVKDIDDVTVYGTKTRRGLDGTFETIREVYAKLKESTPEPIRHISEIIETCWLHDDAGEETDEYKYYKWLTSAHRGTYQTISDKALAEALTGIFLAAYRKGNGRVLAINKYGVMVDTVFATIQPPQSPRIEPKRRIRRFRTTRSRTIKKDLMIGRVPRRCSTTYHFREVAEMVVTTPGYTPPIRGDCKLRRSIRAKPPYFPKTDQINYFKPP